MVALDQVGEDSLRDWKHLVDIGDHIGIQGEVISSRRGELSVLADEWMIVAKALRPLPVAHKALSDETRSRQRYVDLVVNPEAREMVRTRATVLRSVRETMSGEDTSRSRRRCCSSSMAARRHVLSIPISTRSTYR